MTNTERLKQVWNAIYDPNTQVVEVVEMFFHPDYEQCINGVTMDRDQYIQHVIEQKQNMTVESIDYKHVLEQQDELFAVYYPRGKNGDNLPLAAEVIAYYRFKNNKIFRIQGLVRLIEGDLSDVDMGRDNVNTA